MTIFEKEKIQYYEQQKESNAAIDKNRADYMQLEQGAVADYCDSVLSNSVYPDYFPKDWDLEYNAETRVHVIEYVLPAPDTLPSVKGVQYVQSKDEFKESYHSEKEREVLYVSAAQ